MRIFLGSQVEKEYILILQRADGVIRALKRTLSKAHYLSLKQLEGMKKEGTNYRVIEIKEL